MFGIVWLSLGVFNWVILCFYRIWTDSWPWNEPMMSYVRGFVGCLLLGPLTPVLLYIIGEKPKIIRDCTDLDVSEFT